MNKSINEILKHPLFAQLNSLPFAHPLEIGLFEVDIDGKSLMLFPLQNEHETIDLYCIDITHLHKAEKKWQIYAAVTEAAEQSVLMTDTNGVIFFVSPGFEKLTGYRSQEVIGNTPQILKAGFHNQEFYERLWGTIKAGNVWDGEVINRRKDGSLFTAHLTITPIRDGQGVVSGFASLHKDISNLKGLEENLKKALGAAQDASRAKSEFLATMSHEIRTPMNAILGVAHLLSETSLSDEQRKFVSLFETAGQTLLNVINDILDLSKVESGHMELTLAPFALGELITTISDLTQPAIAKKGLIFSITNMLPKTLFVLGDQNRLRQVLMNLVNNSVKFTHHGQINLLIWEKQSFQNQIELEFQLSDTGIGITPEKIPLLFQNFQQVHSKKDNQYGGTGLGLAISKKLIELMGGSISVKSELNKGTTFTFTTKLEVLAPQEYQQIIEQQAKITQKISQQTQPILKDRIHILVAEDMVENQILISAYLRNTSVSLDFAPDGQAALKMIKENNYDLIFLDIQMPLLDGYQTLHEIRKWHDGRGKPKIPIISLTAMAFKEDLEKSRAAGFDDHLTKPLTKETLISTIKRFYSWG